jgi:excisionase family DNA binding protein
VASIKRPQTSSKLTVAAPVPMGVFEQFPPGLEDQHMSPTTTATGAPTQLAFTSSQAASYLGVSLATVRRWSNDGHLRGSRTPGGQRRFSRDQLDAFLRSLTSGGDDGPSAA